VRRSNAPSEHFVQVTWIVHPRAVESPALSAPAGPLRAARPVDGQLQFSRGQGSELALAAGFAHVT